MATYVLRRLIQSVPILLGIAVISFMIIYLAPGEPIDRFRSGRVSPQTIENLRRLYGLDQPLPQPPPSSVVAIRLDLFPLFGRHTYGDDSIGDLVWHLVLPVMTLTIVSVAGWSRYMRSSMLEVLHQDYVRTARAKGLPGSRVLFKHALRNALIPIVTLLGLTIPSLLVGAAVNEAVFAWPGLGGMGVTAVIERDYPAVLAFVMVGGAMVILGNLLADVLYAFVDPRIKY